MELLLSDIDRKIELPDAVFGQVLNVPLIHQVVVAYAAGGRSGTHAQKSRGEVKASGKKPWRQKGTGRARAGSVASPLWRSGGVTFAAKPLSYAQKVNRKMYRAAMRSILSELLRSDRLVALESFSLDAAKTKLLKAKLLELGLEKALIVTATTVSSLARAAKNLPGVDVCTPSELTPFRLIKFDRVLVTAEAIKQIEEWLL